MLFFESKPLQFVGIDIGSGGVKLVELRAQNKRPYLFTYGFADEPVPFRMLRSDDERVTTIDATAALIKQVAAQAKTVSTAAVASLSPRDVFATILTIPQVSTKDFSATVAHEIEKLLPFPLAEAQLDTRKIEALPGETQLQKSDRVFVTAARRKVIQMYSEICSRAGFKLQAIETETFASIRSLLATDSSPVLIIDLGKTFTSFTFVMRTVPLVDVVIETGGDKINDVLARAWNKSPEDVEQMKKDLFEDATAVRDPQIEALLAPLHAPIIKEIEIVFETARRSALGMMSRPDKIILTGGASSYPGLQEKIESHFSVKTYIGDPWSRVIAPPGLRPVLDRIGARFSVAIGLAERMIVS